MSEGFSQGECRRHPRLMTSDHVGRGPDHHPHLRGGGRQRNRGRHGRTDIASLRLKRLRQPEVQHLHRAVVLDRAIIFREWGMLLRGAGDPAATDLAIEKFEMALKETPDDALAAHALAKMVERKGHYRRVIEILEPLAERSGAGAVPFPASWVQWRSTGTGTIGPNSQRACRSQQLLDRNDLVFLSVCLRRPLSSSISTTVRPGSVPFRISRRPCALKG